MVNSFLHRVGYHCESSSMRDLFEFYEFPMSEPMAFGLDATMGFGFFDTTNNVSFIPELDIPFFLGGKQGTIEPNSLGCRLLGIALRKQSFTSADKAWEESKKLIDQDIPLILQIDLGYLPYFEEEGEIHHLGIETEDLEALVTHMKRKGFQFKKQIKSLGPWKYVMAEAPDHVLLELFEVVKDKITQEQYKLISSLDSKV